MDFLQELGELGSFVATIFRNLIRHGVNLQEFF